MAIRKIVSRSIGTDVIAAEDLANNSVTVAEITDGAVTEPKTNFGTSTDSIAIPKGTTAQQPSATEGHIRYDTDKTAVMYSDGSSWYKVSAVIPVLSSVSGRIYEGVDSDLTLTGSGFLSANLVVNFTQASDGIDEDVTVTPSTDTSATVSVPSAVYSNVTAGNVVAVKVTNSDSASSGVVNKTAESLPTGGTISTSGGYRYHKFTSSDNFVIPSSSSITSVDYTMVAGGGGTGFASNIDTSGGGGAGGLLNGSTSVSSTTYSIVIGAGGTYGVSPDGDGQQGSNTTGLGLTAIGGGLSTYRGNGGNGGSGGGGGRWSATGGSGTSGQGNDGGAGGVNDGTGSRSSGGGGGAGAIGQTATSASNGGDGGAGLQYSTWATATSSGDGGYYAGGGGGANSAGSEHIPQGGAGGGGNGGYFNSPGNAGEDGAANTGGGAGGSWAPSGGNTNGSTGGSGIFLIRYQL